VVTTHGGCVEQRLVRRILRVVIAIIVRIERDVIHGVRRRSLRWRRCIGLVVRGRERDGRQRLPTIVERIERRVEWRRIE